MRVSLIDEMARELAGMPAEWYVYSYRSLMDDKNTTEYIGAIAPLKGSGENKGEPNWDAMDVDTKRTVYATEKDASEWRKSWAKKTGKCSECVGTVEVFQSWSVGVGVKYKKCMACVGTGATK